MLNVVDLHASVQKPANSTEEERKAEIASAGRFIVDKHLSGVCDVSFSYAEELVEEFQEEYPAAPKDLCVAALAHASNKLQDEIYWLNECIDSLKSLIEQCDEAADQLENED